MSDEQPPAGDQSPMSGSQPPTDPPPAAPTNPYETPAAPPPPPAQSPYGTPPPAQPQYGTPQYGAPTYGTPAPAQPAMAGGYPGMPGMPGAVEPPPSKAMAITALVTSLICCTPVGLILAIIVIVRSKDGRNHGKGLAIAALIISIIFSIGIAIGGYALTQVDWDEVARDLSPVQNLQTGDCFDSDDLMNDKSEIVDITETSCNGTHDAEVLFARDLTADEAENWPTMTEDPCFAILTEKGLLDKADLSLYDVGGLTIGDDPNAGDNLACIAYRIDRTTMDAPL